MFRSILLVMMIVATLFNNTCFDCAVRAQSPNASAESNMTFLSHRSGYNQIYTTRRDGTDLTPVFGGPITDVPSFSDSYTMVREPHWTRQSPDGKLFASWVYVTGKPYEKYQGGFRPMLWVGDIRGTWTRIVNTDCHEEFAWSPDSRSLAFSVLSQSNYNGSLQARPKTTEIFTIGIDGSNELCLLEQEGTWIVLDWSPDGQRLLLSRRDIQKHTGELFEFHHKDAYKAALKSSYDPHWNVNRAKEFLKPVKVDFSDLQFNSCRYSPTRNEIACEIYDNKNMYTPRLPSEAPESFMPRLLAKIYVADLESGTAHKVADFEDGIRGPICWSPEGDEILFSRYLPKDDKRESSDTRDANGLAIWGVGRDGENARFITTGWSPDFPSSAKDTKSTR